MKTFFNDLRYSVRMLVKHPGFTAVVVLTLALGIGANTAVFSVLNAVVLEPLLFEHPEQLVMIRETGPRWGTRKSTASYPQFQDWRGRSTLFSDMAAFHPKSRNLSGTETPLHIQTASVTDSFFSTLRVQPALGRLFTPEDCLPYARMTVVLSHGLWMRCYEGNPDVLGKTLKLDDELYTIIGVLRPDFAFPVDISEAQAWTPKIPSRWDSRGSHYLRVVARLKADATLRQAQTQMDSVARQLELEHTMANKDCGVRLCRVHEEVVQDARPRLLMLLGAAGLVLLIACANVANLILARSTLRRQELAVRVALGASRFQLVRQLLTESALLSLLGGMLGLLLAVWGRDAIVAIIPPDVPRAQAIGVDLRVLGFAITAAMLAGLAAGLAPAIKASRLSPAASLKHGARATTSRIGSDRSWLQNTLIVSQIALTLLLLVGAGLLLRSFQKLTDAPVGFQPENLLTFRISMDEEEHSLLEARYTEILQLLNALPGVHCAAASSSLPLRSNSELEGDRLSITILGRPEPPEGSEPTARCDLVSPTYFAAMDIPLRSGRVFTDQDTQGRSAVMIINETMARRHWPGEDPIGRRLGRLPYGNAPQESWEIVGVVADACDRDLDSEPEPHMFVPYRQVTFPAMRFVLRTAGEPLDLVAAVRNETASVAPLAPAYDFKTMRQYLTDVWGPRRFPMILLSIFSALALLLAMVGIYGLLSYSVAQRTHEIGVRMAIGAQRGDVLRSVLMRGLALSGVGVGVGLLLALAATRVLSNMLFDISATDSSTFVGVGILLTLVAATACYIPARRATQVDPMTALRCE